MYYNIVEIQQDANLDNFNNRRIICVKVFKKILCIINIISNYES